MTTESEQALARTPYLTQGDTAAEARFETIHARSIEVRERALATQERISAEATEILGPYAEAMRSDLVAESNRIEGYEWRPHQVRELVAAHRELLNAPVGSFMAALRGDSRVYQVLGLYRAHKMADEWAGYPVRPREFEIRALHELITSGELYAGRYKEKSNKIAGSSHKTLEPWDIPQAMSELCAWWTSSSTDPLLDATVVHAWLTHIHPFEDGNGRMARLLANLALIQAGYPPFLIRSGADRGQYYDALAASDDGDILPLYDLVATILRRTVRTMSSPGYVRDVVHDRLLTTAKEKHSMWCRLPQQFESIFRTELNKHGWIAEVQGYPDPSSFALLADRDSDGNSWFLKILDDRRRAAWLFWYGFNSDWLVDAINGPSGYPSVFISVRDLDPSAVHPYRPILEEGEIPNELLFRPLERKPVMARWGHEVDEMSLQDAAVLLAEGLT